MATKKYRCTNYAQCDIALSKEVIEIEDGADVICPGCKMPKSLALEGQSAGSGSGGRSKKLFVGAGVLLVVALIAWVFWPASPNPESANALLSEFFPGLPK